MAEQRQRECEKRPSYTFDEDRMIDEGLAGGKVETEYESPAIDESRPLKKDVKPKGPKKEKGPVIKKYE
ncbi:hypothetical protein JOD43_002007 [Pullulanibacillus pueri]|uniref:Uncharacterized protein n=1 Tax=Pullulanibacillus pueri TaxID=1437324 RepID=A0A8J2ZTZ3_9BACL|nr:hypothetical protein [Pullulanibacillus pueri]MBM7681835.1 hypothetical protein [Pullulanibacillus pueri]GGH76276.1 hypothetical protein GCM10007096_06460 [Pullulanibacillus pueri]